MQHKLLTITVTQTKKIQNKTIKIKRQGKKKEKKITPPHAIHTGSLKSTKLRASLTPPTEVTKI
jgi:hypothetical protein